MTEINNINTQEYFPEQNIPANTSQVYNNPQFLRNEMHIFGSNIQQMSDGIKKGLEEIKNSINN